MKIDNIKASDIMSKTPVTAKEHEQLSEIMGKMRKHNVHEIPIVSGDKLKGIVSYDTLMKRKNIPLTTKVEKIMSLPPKIYLDEKLPEIAEALMVGGHRALPIISEDRIMGIVSRTDIVRAMKNLLEVKDIRLEKIMTPNPQCIRGDDTILEARNIMKNLDERTVPVVDKDGKLKGVVGVKDIVEVFSKSKDKKASMEAKGAEINIEVKGIMSTPPVSLGPQNKVSEALDLMINKDISSVVVVKDENPVGIVTQIDLLELLTSFRESPQLYVQITGLEEDSEVYDIMYDIIRKVMKRISKIVNPKVLNLHVVQHHHVGLRSKYAFRARMITDKKMYYTSAFEWDLLKALDEVMKQLEKTIKKEKERRLDRRKHRKKS